jgi:lysophospholipase L1-like esterase
MKQLTLILVLTLSIAAGHAAAQPLNADSVRIVVLGSSTASATGASAPDSGWVWRYAAFLKTQHPANEVINLSVGGYTTYHIQPSRFRAPTNRPDPDTMRNITAAIALRPSAIIINLPSNDAAKKFGLDERVENLVRVANRAERAGIPLWVCTSQPRNMSDPQRVDLESMRDWIAGMFRENAMDFWSPLATIDGRIRPLFDFGDGVHLNDAGHRALFEAVRDVRIPERLYAARVETGIRPRPSLELRVVPTPAKDFVTFRIRTVHKGGYTLLISDLLGKEVRRIKGDVRPGVSMRFLHTGKLNRGIYRALLQNGPAIMSSKIILTR